jgi:hypothetical protein
MPFRCAGSLALAAIFALAAPPADAFEALRNAVSRLPASAVAPDAPIAFDFLSPRTIRDWDLRDNPGSADRGVDAALVHPEAAAALTGIDFPALDAVLTFGVPPRIVTFLAGPGLSADRVAAAYRTRGYEESAEFGAVVFAHGEDNRMDFADRNPNDPFGGSLGLAQRIAVGPLGLLATRAWEPLREALAMATAEAPRSPADEAAGALLAALVEAAAARDPAAVAYAAEGLGMAAVGPPEESAGAPARSDGIGAFRLAILVAAESEAEESATLVVAFPDADAAAAAAPRLLDRLRAFVPAETAPGARFEQSLGRHGETGIAVVAVVFDRSEAHPAARQFTRWRGAILSRRFAPLND